MDKTRKRFSSFFKIKIFIPLLILIFPNFAFAFWEFLASIGSFILSTTLTILAVSLVVILVLQLLLGAMGIINTLLSNLVSWIIRPGAIGWHYTRNVFVNAGLEITGGFVSIGLVLALVAIAFATILRLEGWDTKRLLIKLGIVAILINFAPLICGLIVDASNIFMYYFSDRIGGIGVLTTTFLNIVENIIRAFVGIPIIQQVNTVAIAILQLIFQIYLSFCLIAFLLLFMFRVSAIWIFTILSPIAFICWILPATKKYWDFWWDNFLKWCLAGPICAFFLYLGSRAAEIITLNPATFASLQNFVSGPLYQIIPFIFPLGLLNLGIVLGVRGAGIGSEIALNWTRRGVGWVGQKAVRSRPMRWAMGKVGQTPEYMERAATWLRRWDALAPVAAGLSRGSSVIRPYLAPYAVRAREVAPPKDFEKMTPEEQEKIVQSPVYRSYERAQLLGKMADLGTLAKTSEEFQRTMAKEMELVLRNPALRTQFSNDIKKFYDALFNELTEEAKLNLAPNLQVRANWEREISQRERELREEYNRNPEFKNLVDQEFRRSGRTLRDIAAGVLHFEQMRPGDVSKVPGRAIQSVEAIWGTHRMGPAKFQAIINTFDFQTAQRLLEAPGGWNQMYQNVKGKPEEEIALLLKQRRENPHFFNWLFTSEVGRQLSFAGRDIVTREFQNYGIFRTVVPEYEKFVGEIEKINRLEEIETQLINIQKEYAAAVAKKQKERIKLINALSPELERKAQEIISGMRDKNEVNRFLNRFGQLHLQPGFREGPAHKVLPSINSELYKRWQQLP
jgi:hypothetical protein